MLGKTGDVSNTTTYAGYQYDEETGLYYLNARYYDSTVARFITEDTYYGERKDPLSLNLYTYCMNDPLKYYDPSGHNFKDIYYGAMEVFSENKLNLYANLYVLCNRDYEYEDEVDYYAGRLGADLWNIGAGFLLDILGFTLSANAPQIGGGIGTAVSSVGTPLAGVAVGGATIAVVELAGGLIVTYGTSQIVISGGAALEDGISLISAVNAREAEEKSQNNYSKKTEGQTSTNDYVKIEGKGSTGRTKPNDLVEEIAMDYTKKNPFDPGEGNTVRRIIDSLGDTRWKGWEKWEVVYRTDSGRIVTIHFSYDPVNNLFDDFKFKN